jgi:hypothetical protein
MRRVAHGPGVIDEVCDVDFDPSAVGLLFR